MGVARARTAGFGAALAAWALGGAYPMAAAADLRGMTVSTPTWGWEWGSDAMADSLDVLGALGVNWVAIHPYARIGGDGAVQWRPFDPDAPPEWIARPIHEAHARGIKIAIIPHLAHWGSPFSWRGAIVFPDPAARGRFFADYTRWIRTLGRAARGADAFVVGSELDGTAPHEAEWRAVIAAVRAEFPGPLTYAANWDRFEQVPFWDALDAAGIQAYFPLVGEGAAPTDAAIATGWAQVMARVRRFHARTGKPVVFTELGYDAAPTAAARPWEHGTEGPRVSRSGAARARAPGADVQQRCLRAALRAIDREPSVVGAFLWKWFPGELDHGDFRMSDPAVRAVIAEVWRP